MRRALVGFCPACGQQKLAANPSGMIVCCNLDCARPTAVAELLTQPPREHTVQLDRDDFTLEHPLVERLDGGLFTCELTEEIAVSGPFEHTGRYLARLGPDGLELTPTEVSSTSGTRRGSD